MSRPKVFGVGLNKTGTTTLSKCGAILGYNCKGFDRKLMEACKLRNDLSAVKESARHHDLFQDWPWPLVYREMDEMFPGSKFILTTRKDEHTWLESLKKHSMVTPPFRHSRKLAYGYNYPHKYEQEHLNIYREHNRAVREYFKGREADFLEVCWENGDGFEILCEFLKKKKPDLPMPHTNKAGDKEFNRKRYLINKFMMMIS